MCKFAIFTLMPCAPSSYNFANWSSASVDSRKIREQMRHATATFRCLVVTNGASRGASRNSRSWWISEEGGDVDGWVWMKRVDGVRFWICGRSSSPLVVSYYNNLPLTFNTWSSQSFVLYSVYFFACLPGVENYRQLTTVYQSKIDTTIISTLLIHLSSLGVEFDSSLKRVVLVLTENIKEENNHKSACNFMIQEAENERGISKQITSSINGWLGLDCWIANTWFLIFSSDLLPATFEHLTTQRLTIKVYKSKA